MPPSNLIPRIRPICALLLNPLSLHPHPTTAPHVLPPTPPPIITTRHSSQEVSPLLCSGLQRFYQARIPRHAGPYRPGWYSSYRIRVGQRSPGRPCFRSSWYVHLSMLYAGVDERVISRTMALSPTGHRSLTISILPHFHTQPT